MATTGLQGLGAARARVLEQLLGRDRTATEVATALRIQVSAARKHLERVAAIGLVDHRFERGGAGRPKKRYFLSEAGREAFPRMYDRVLNALLDRLAADEGEERVRELLAGVAGDVAGPGTQSLPRLLRTLNAAGFSATATREKGRSVITSRNCPILKTAGAHRERVCEGLHGELLRRATGRSVRREAWIVDGEPVCTHVIG